MREYLMFEGKVNTFCGLENHFNGLVIYKFIYLLHIPLL